METCPKWTWPNTRTIPTNLASHLVLLSCCNDYTLIKRLIYSWLTIYHEKGGVTNCSSFDESLICRNNVSFGTPVANIRIGSIRAPNVASYCLFAAHSQIECFIYGTQSMEVRHFMRCETRWPTYFFEVIFFTKFKRMVIIRGSGDFRAELTMAISVLHTFHTHSHDVHTYTHTHTYTNTHLEYVILSAFLTATMVTCLNVALFMYTACLVK